MRKTADGSEDVTGTLLLLLPVCGWPKVQVNFQWDSGSIKDRKCLDFSFQAHPTEFQYREQLKSFGTC